MLERTEPVEQSGRGADAGKLFELDVLLASRASSAKTPCLWAIAQKMGPAWFGWPLGTSSMSC